MERGAALTASFTLLVVLLAGCAGDTLAPVSDRTISGSRSAEGYYEVRRGDTLYGIAWDHGLDHRDLAEWNQLDSADRIRVGQRLRLEPPRDSTPDRTQAAAASQPSPQSSSASSSPSSTSGGTDGGATPRAGGTAEEPGDWQWPTEGEVVKAFSRDADGKQGISIGGDPGQPVVAVADGEVVYSGAGLVGYGNLVILKHGGDFLTAYGYNRRVLVDEGDRVSAGDRIAEMGSAVGDDGTRLHFELRRGGQAVNPLDYLP